MTLYLYKVGTTTPSLTIENVIDYTDRQVTAKTAEGETILYAPLADGVELSATADCTGTLRADYREMGLTEPVTEHPFSGNLLADCARNRRDKLLAETDWTQVLDAPIDEETKAAYRAYRQALRDIPQQEGFPETILWPELPEKVKAEPEPVDEAVELLLSGATGEEAAE